MSCFGRVSQPHRIARFEQKPSAAYSGWIWHWKNRLLLTGHQKLWKKLPNLQINGFHQPLLLFLTWLEWNRGYKKKKNKTLFLSSRIYGCQTLLSHELTKNYDKNYSLYEGEVNLTPFFAQRADDQRKEQCSHPNYSLMPAKINCTEGRKSLRSCLQSQTQAAPAAPAPILPLNGICLNTKSKLLMIIVLCTHCIQKDKSFLIQAGRHVRTEKKQKENTSKIPLTLHSPRIRTRETFSPFLTQIQSATQNQWTALSLQVTWSKTFFVLQLYSLDKQPEFS